MNISFTGVNQFENIKILGEPIRQKTNLSDDLQFLRQIIKNIVPKSDFSIQRTPNLQTLSSDSLKLQFFNSNTPLTSNRVHITDLKENITRILKKSEHQSSEYSKLFKEFVTTITESVIKTN